MSEQKKVVPNPMDVLVEGYAALGLKAKMVWEKVGPHQMVSVELTDASGAVIDKFSMTKESDAFRRQAEIMFGY